MDAVAVSVRDRRNGGRYTKHVELHDDDTVDDVLRRIGDEQHPSSNMQLVLGGQTLPPSTRVSDLLLGPSTNLLALVLDTECASIASTGDASSPQMEIKSTFFVVCKKCEDVRRAKLRVFCSQCGSSNVIVRREPNGWDDVLNSNRVEVDCEDCQGSNVYARFAFKCTTCSEVSAVLSHLRLPDSPSSCCVCFSSLSSSSPSLDLGCSHLTCLPCFRLLVSHALQSSSFRMIPPYGYTLGCAYPVCPAVVRDAHHFAIIGRSGYREYQRRATEKLVSLDAEGVSCPYADCGSSFLWEDGNGERRSLHCPECEREFCRRCRSVSAECVCEQETASAATIRVTTRCCPRCNAATERNGGCAHIQCIVCGTHWCFVCASDWTEECQWNHWFS